MKKELPLDYFLWVFALAVPFWIVGGGKLPLPFNLPVAALGTFVPMAAAAIVTYRRQGRQGVQALFRRALDFRKMQETGKKAWWVPMLLIMPLIYLLAYGVMRLVGLPLPDPIDVPLLLAPVFLVMFLIGGAGEELGWTGYAIDPLQDRWGALKGSLLLGAIWAVWHAIPFVLTGNPAAWIAWQSLYTVVLRVLITWMYDNTGKSVFVAIMIHAMSNVCWSLFPNFGSHYDPAVTSTVALVVTVAGIILAGWGGKAPEDASSYALK